MVVGTGYQTFIGRTASLIGDPMPDRLSQKRQAEPRYAIEYHDILRSIGFLVLAIAVIAVSLVWVFYSPARSSHQLMGLILGLAIIAFPASMGTFVSTIRSQGVVRLSEEGCLAQEQTMGGEALAGIDILCCDKTGTITQNQLDIFEPYCISCDPEDLILTANLSSSPNKEKHDAIEQAIAKALEQYPQAKADMERYEVLKFEPFNVETKRIQSLVKTPDGERILCVKGAPRALLEDCLQDHPDKEVIREKYINKAKEYASRGYRSLGIARKREHHYSTRLAPRPLRYWQWQRH